MPTPSRVVQFFQHMKTKAIGYVRVSTDKQADRGVSLEAQVEKIRAMAAVHDVELLDVLVDAGESALDVVPGFQGFVLLMVGSRVGLRAGGGAGRTSFSAPAALAPAQHRPPAECPRQRPRPTASLGSFENAAS